MDCQDDSVFEKYQVAGNIANKTLKGLILNCKTGKNVYDICVWGDMVIKKQLEKVYKSDKKMQKGIAFPTCISVNECVCHFCPLEKDEKMVLKDGDVVKIDLGVQIDGYIAVLAHTLIVGHDPETKPLDEKASTLFTAARVAVDAAHKLIRPGAKNSELMAMFKNVAKSYGVSCVEACLSHQMKRFVIDGNKTSILKESHDQQVADFEFELGEAYAIDICLSTGDGKTKQGEERTTVHKRIPDVQYMLKRKTSRFVLNEVQKHFPALPFTLRAISDTKQAKAGVIECVKHDLLQPFPVIYEKSDGALVAHFKFTLLLRKTSTMRMTGTDSETALFKSLGELKCDKEPNEELKKVLALSTKRKKRRKKRKKKKKKAADGDN